MHFGFHTSACNHELERQEKIEWVDHGSERQWLLIASHTFFAGAWSGIDTLANCKKVEHEKIWKCT